MTSHECQGDSYHWKLQCLFNSLFSLQQIAHQSATLLAGNYWRGIHQWLVYSHHKVAVMRKAFTCYGTNMHAIVLSKSLSPVYICLFFVYLFLVFMNLTGSCLSCLTQWCSTLWFHCNWKSIYFLPINSTDIRIISNNWMNLIDLQIHEQII